MGRIYIARCQTGKDFLTLLTSIQHMIEGTSYTDTSSSDSNSTHIYSHHDEQKQRQSGSGKEVTTSLVVTFEADTLLFSSGHDEHKDPLSSSSASAPAVSSLSSAINDKQRQPAAADVSVLLIDNISTFYWEEYVKGTVFPFYEQVVAALRALMDRCHLPLIVTKQCFIKSQVHMLESQLRHKEALGRKWASLITLRLLLKKEGPNNNNKPNSTNGSSSGGNSNSNSYHIPHLPSNHEPYHCLGHLRLEKSIHSLSSSAVMTDAQCQHRYRSLMNLLTPTKLAQAGSIGTDAGMMSTGDHSRRLQSTGDDSNTIRWWTFRCNFWDTGIQQLD